MKRSREVKPILSVVIPTYNRAALLHSALQSLVGQSLSKSLYEVVVVNDGSTDDTEEVCRGFANKIPLQYFYQENSGISAAKNLGVFASRGTIIFFFDDDDVAHGNLLAEHVRAHNERPEENVAFLGYTTWHRGLHVTPLMHYITEVGQFLFAYKALKHGQLLDFTYFWGGRTSCKRAFLVKHGVFNQDFLFTEDIELGFRLSRHGLQVVHNRNAISYMLRPITFPDFCRRCERQGRGLYLFSRLHRDHTVQRYCQVVGAEEQWEYFQYSLEEKMARVYALEEKLSRREGKDGRNDLRELMDLYGWVFMAHRFKGIVEAKGADAQQAPGKGSIGFEGIDRQETRYVRSKWLGRTPPSYGGGRVLIVDYLLPMFDRSSGSKRIFEIIKILRKLGCAVTYLAVDGEEGEEVYRPILEGMGVEVVSGGGVARQTLGRESGGHAIDYEAFFADRKFACAIVEFWHLGEYYLPLIRKYSPATTVIIDSVDVHFVREGRRTIVENRRDQKELVELERDKYRELRVYAHADRVWVVTEEDKKALEESYLDRPIDVIPNIHEEIEEEKKFAATEGLLFVGNFNHLPNRDAAAYFIAEIYPLIVEELKDVKLIIVGNNPPESIKELSSPLVEVTGYVKDLAPYLRSARVSVNPLRYGAGMKGKIGEALSWGLPVVTTTVGAEGMGLVHGENVLIADDPRSFAREVVRLYSDRHLWGRLSKGGRAKMAAAFSPAAVEERIIGILKNIEEEKRETDGGVIVKGYPPLDFSTDLVSIIILARDKWHYTRACLDAVVQYSHVPFEIVLVDNASEEPLYRYLDDWRRGYQGVSLTYLRLATNAGFARGCNRGVSVSRGNYLVFLNNDAVVAPDWLDILLTPLKGDDRIAATGPMSNHVNGWQWVKDCPLVFTDPERLDVAKLKKYAAMTARRFRDHYINVYLITGLCMAIRRDVFVGQGGFDERFYPGNFEDADLSMRLRLAGYRLYVCRGAFVYHFGNVTFQTLPEGYGDNYHRNRKEFLSKWNIEDGVSERAALKTILAGKYDTDSLILDNVLLRAPFVREIDGGDGDAVDLYLSHLYRTGAPFIMVVQRERGEEVYRRMLGRYGEENLNNRGEIILFEGTVPELWEALGDGERYRLYRWAEPLDEDTLVRDHIIVM